MAKKFINDKVNIETGGEDEYFASGALEIAIAAQDICFVKQLLDKGADPNRAFNEMRKCRTCFLKIYKSDAPKKCTNKSLMKINVLILFAWLPALLFAQNKPANNKLFERLQAITENKVDYYDVDGVTITCQVTQIPFSKENICKGLSIQESELKKSSPAIAATNFVFEQIDTLCGDILQYSTNYIVQNEKGNITHIIYMSVNKRCDELQQILTPLILEKKIPESVYNKKFFNTLNFAGRKIELGTYACGWTNVNCVQCPYHGEMSWSVHKDSADAALSVETQRYVTANCKMQAAQPTADEWVAVVFENQPLKARRITYRFEGETAALLLNTGGGNTHSLTIYYVVAPVRGNYVSCILSFWNNDLLEEASGLPSLLEKVMQLKEK